MPVEVLDVEEVTKLSSDGEEKPEHFGLVIFGHCVKHSKKTLPVLYIPLKNGTIDKYFPEDFEKVDCISNSMRTRITLYKYHNNIKTGVTLHFNNGGEVERLMNTWRKIMPKIKIRTKHEQLNETERNVLIALSKSLNSCVRESTKFSIYTKFTLENESLKKKDLKKKLFEIKSLPDYLRSCSTACLCYSYWFTLLGRFSAQHKCGLKTCSGFSLVKCSLCLTARYCDASCQDEDFSNHSGQECQELARRMDQKKFLYTSFEQIFAERLDVSSLKLSFESFFSLLCSRVFSDSYNLLDEKVFDTLQCNTQQSQRDADGQLMHSALANTGPQHMKTLLKREPLPQKTIFRQLRGAFGNPVPQFMKHIHIQLEKEKAEKKNKQFVNNTQKPKPKRRLRG